MNITEACKQKSEGETELSNAELDEMKAKARIASADRALEFSRETDDFENTSDTKQEESRRSAEAVADDA